MCVDSAGITTLSPTPLSIVVHSAEKIKMLIHSDVFELLFLIFLFYFLANKVETYISYICLKIRALYQFCFSY